MFDASFLGDVPCRHLRVLKIIIFKVAAESHVDEVPVINRRPWMPIPYQLVSFFSDWLPHLTLRDPVTHRNSEL